MIDENRVTEIFSACMFGSEELVDGVPIEGASIICPVEGIGCSVGFHKVRLASFRSEIKGMLSQLILGFRTDLGLAGLGGGRSFFLLRFVQGNEQWTDDVLICEQLLLLALALEFATYLVPKEKWHQLPGAIPYVSIDLSKKTPEDILLLLDKHNGNQH